MHFPDIPFNSEGPSFIGHKRVLEYLKDYADQFGLNNHIQVLIFKYSLIN